MFPTLKASFFTLICREQWPIFPYECAQRSRRLIRMSRSIRPARRRFAHSRTVEIVAYFRRGPPIVLSSWRAQLILAPRLSMALPRRGKAHDRNNRPIRQIYATRIFSWKIESVPGCSPVIHSSPRPVKGDAFAFPQDTRARAPVSVRPKIIALIKEPRERKNRTRLHSERWITGQSLVSRKPTTHFLPFVR